MNKLKHVLGSQKNPFIETFLLSTHNMFGLEIRKLILIMHSYQVASKTAKFSK